MHNFFNCFVTLVIAALFFRSHQEVVSTVDCEKKKDFPHLQGKAIAHSKISFDVVHLVYNDNSRIVNILYIYNHYQYY